MPARLDENSTCTAQTYTNFGEQGWGPCNQRYTRNRSPPLLATALRKKTLVKEPMKRKRMAVLGPTKHFRKYAAGSTHVAVS